jgi:uncharacterized membrane-anchored protein YitT (DUF2179 family)
MRFETIKRIVLVLFGSAITAVGLQFFLLPNHLLDGGVTGMAIIAAELSGIPIGVYLLILNIPFIILGYKKFGREFTVLSVIGVTMLALLTMTHFDHGFTDIPILAAVFGGVFIGMGLGIVVRYGGIIDGADTIAVLVDRITTFSVSEVVFVLNGIIVILGGFVFGWEAAMYSLVAYFVAHKVMEMTVEGMDESRSVLVVSMHAREIGRMINELIQEPVTYIKESNARHREPHGIMMVVITRFEEQKIKRAILAADSHAYILIASAHEVIGRVSEGTLYKERNA